MVMMDDGLVIEEGRPEHSSLRPSNERTRQFLSKILMIAGRRGRPGACRGKAGLARAPWRAGPSLIASPRNQYWPARALRWSVRKAIELYLRCGRGRPRPYKLRLMSSLDQYRPGWR